MGYSLYAIATLSILAGVVIVNLANDPITAKFGIGLFIVGIIALVGAIAISLTGAL